MSALINGTIQIVVSIFFKVGERMANEKNLIPLNKRAKNEQREIQSKGGKARAKKQNEQKTFKELAQTILSLRPNSDELLDVAESLGAKNIDNKQLVVIGLTLSAIRGNHNAFDRLLELTGENEHTTDEQTKQADLLSAIEKAVKNDN